MDDGQEVQEFIQKGREILRTRRPHERQRRWREWRDEAQRICDSLATTNKPRLVLTFNAFTQDIRSLDEWLRAQASAKPEAKYVGRKIESEVVGGSAGPSTDANQQSDLQADEHRPVRVFLSYRSADEKIAKAVKSELESLDDRVEVFAAYDDLRKGGRWKEQLLEALGASSWFILIYTDPEMDWQWPIYEATTFEAVHTRSDGGDKRLCCFHDTDERPKPLSEYQSNRIELFVPDPNHDEEVRDLKKESFYKESSVFRFLRDFLRYPANDPLTRDIRRYEGRLTEAAHTISEAFIKNRQDSVLDQKYYPARIEISFRPDGSKSTSNAIGTATVFLGDIAGKIFKLAKIEDLVWEDFRKHLAEQGQGFVPVWIEQLENALFLASEGVEPDAIMATMYSSWTRRFYRPLLTRQEYYLSGKRKFYIVLVEQPPTDFTEHEDQGTLLAALILGSRFRFEFIDRRLDQLGKDLSEIDLRTLCSNIKGQILAIENEAAQHGLMDREGVIECFSRSDQETVGAWYDRWGEIRQEIFDVLDQGETGVSPKESVVEKLRDLLNIHLRAVNSGFMKLGAARYGDLVQSVFKD